MVRADDGTELHTSETKDQRGRERMWCLTILFNIMSTFMDKALSPKDSSTFQLHQPADLDFNPWGFGGGIQYTIYSHYYKNNP